MFANSKSSVTTCKPLWYLCQTVPAVNGVRIFAKEHSIFIWIYLPTHHFGTKHFGTSHFSADVSSWEHFGTCTLPPCGCSGKWTFQYGTVSTWGFGTWIFWYLTKQYVRSDTDILAPVLLCQNVPVLKCSCAENSSCQKFLVSKSPHVEVFRC